MSVRPLSRHADHWAGWLRTIAPTVRLLIPLLAVVLVSAFVGTRRLYPDIHLPVSSAEPTIRKETSASRQFATALLHAHDQEAWKAVIRNFPETSEAEMAQMRLALHFATSPVPSFTTALDEFEKLVVAGDVPGKQYLKFLGRVGQTYVISLQADQERAKGRSEQELEDLQRMADTMLSAAYYVYSGPDKEVEMELALANGPQELRDFMRGGNRRSNGFRPGPPPREP